MIKYKQMTSEYQAIEEQKSKKLAGEYEKAITTKPEISYEDQELTPAINVLKVDSQNTDVNILVKEEEPLQHHESAKLDDQSLAFNGEASNVQSVTDIKEVLPTEKNDSIFIDVKDSKSHQPPLVVDTQTVPMAEVVTRLGAEDC